MRREVRWLGIRIDVSAWRDDRRRLRSRIRIVDIIDGWLRLVVGVLVGVGALG